MSPDTDSFDLRCSIAQCIDRFEALNRDPQWFAPSEPWIPAFQIEHIYPSIARIRMTERDAQGLMRGDAIGLALITLTGDGCRLTFSPAAPEQGRKYHLLLDAFVAYLDRDRLITRSTPIAQTTKPVEVPAPRPPDVQASVEEHARWHHKHGGEMTVDEYAKKVMNKAPKTLYNARSTLGLSVQKKSGKKRKPSGN